MGYVYRHSLSDLWPSLLARVRRACRASTRARPHGRALQVHRNQGAKGWAQPVGPAHGPAALAQGPIRWSPGTLSLASLARRRLGRPRRSGCLHAISGARAALHPGVRHGPGQSVLGPPAGAVPGSHQVRCHPHQRGNRRPDYRLERGTAQVKPTDNGVQPVGTGKAQGVANDVDDPRMTSTGHDNQALAPEVHD